LAPGDVVGVEPVRRRRLTAEKVAIAAVMAGCRPDYMPVVLAVVRALCDTAYGLHGVSASTGGSAPFIVVNGPIRNAIGMNATHNALANASRRTRHRPDDAVDHLERAARGARGSIARRSVIPASSRTASPRTKTAAPGHRCRSNAAFRPATRQ